MCCMLKIYVAKAKDLCPDVVRAPLELLTEDRRKKVLALRGEEDRRRGIAAGLLLREALKRESVSAEEAIVKDEHQKPYLKSGACFFNLSHAGMWVVCAVSDVRVGVDVEIKERFCDPEKNRRLARRILTPEEWTLWSKTESGRELLSYWTKKESSVKRTGQGLSQDFRKVDTLRGNWYGTKTLPDGAQISVCTETFQEQPAFLAIE